MLVLGGAGSLYGALIGTVIFMLFEDFVSAANPFHWLTIVGALLIAVVLFAPQGLYGTAAACLWIMQEGVDERASFEVEQSAARSFGGLAVTQRRLAHDASRAIASR